MTDINPWVRALHPDRQLEFFSLPADQQHEILSRSEETRRAAFRFYTQNHFGINGRERWVMGVAQLPELIRDPRHVLSLALKGKVDEVRAVTHLLVDIGAGWHEEQKNTDPRLYDLMCKAHEMFCRVGHDRLDLVGMAQYFKKHPEAKPLTGRQPTPQQIAEKRAMQLGARLRASRKERRMTQATLAQQVNTCEKTIKNLEKGKPVSSHTLLLVQNILAQKTDEPDTTSRDLTRNDGAGTSFSKTRKVGI